MCARACTRTHTHTHTHALSHSAGGIAETPARPVAEPASHRPCASPAHGRRPHARHARIDPRGATHPCLTSCFPKEKALSATPCRSLVSIFAERWGETWPAHTYSRARVSAQGRHGRSVRLFDTSPFARHAQALRISGASAHARGWRKQTSLQQASCFAPVGDSLAQFHVISRFKSLFGLCAPWVL